MSRRAFDPQRGTCNLCEAILSRKSLARHPNRSRPSISRTILPSSPRLYTQRTQRSEARPAELNRKIGRSLEDLGIDATDKPAKKRNPEQAFAELKADVNRLLSLKTLPAEKDVAEVLQRCQSLAEYLVHDLKLPSYDKQDRAASALLSLDDFGRRASQNMRDELSNLAYSIMVHAPVFITPAILRIYVRIQATLKKPETFPEIFGLYANKPVPEEGSSPVRYSNQNPNKVSNAVPKQDADLALQTAIEAKTLVTAMDLIENSYATKAFRRAKFVRKGLIPAAGLAVAPLAAYTLATQLAVSQNTMETGMATNVAFVGMLAYVGFTATIGIVAVTTANDQMDRITWAPGIPLRERWIREEERAAIDKVAGAWGFREVWRRGEEEGEEWDALREWAGLKGMILDRTELMEGME